MQKLLLFIGLLVCATLQTFAQSVAINNDGTTANASAILHIKASNKGLLIPNVALTSINDVATVLTPSISLMVYNTNTAGFVPTDVTPGYYYWGGSNWVRLSNLSKVWELKGNAFISTPTYPATYGTSAINGQFLGTLDAADLVFGTDNKERVRVLGSNGLIGIGTSTPTTLIHAIRNTSGNVINGTSTFVGDIDNIGVVGNAINNPGFGFGGVFTGGYMGIRSYCTPSNYPSVAYALRASIDGSTGPRYGIFSQAFGTGTANNVSGYFAATSGATNYGIIVPNGGGNVGINANTPNNAPLEVGSMIGNTTGIFKGTGAGISTISDWPAIGFNCYYNGGVRAMSAGGYPTYINSNQSNGAIEFLTTTIANTVIDAVNNPIYRMKIQGDGQVSIGVDNTGSVEAVAKLTVKDANIVDEDIPIFTARHSGAAGTTWRMGSIEYYTEGYGSIGFTHQLCPLSGNGAATLGASYNTKYDGYRWGTLYTTTNPNVSSDITLKKNIVPQNYGINALRKITPISYLLKDEYGPQGVKLNDVNKNTYIGFNAQELKQIIPEVVSSTHLLSNAEDGVIEAKTPTLGVRYGDLIPVTITAIKELDEQQQAIIKTINITDFGTETTSGATTTIIFSADFKAKLQGKPVVTISALQPNANVYISKITNNGFTVQAASALTTIEFTWIAIAKINPNSLAIVNKFNEAEQAVKLQKRAAYEANLPTNEEAIKMARAHGEVLRKLKSAENAKNAKEPMAYMKAAMQKASEKAKAEYDAAAKILKQSKAEEPIK